MVGKQAAVSHISQTVGTVIFVFIHLSVSHTIRECSCFLSPSILVTKWSCLILVFFKIVDVQQKNTKPSREHQTSTGSQHLLFSLSTIKHDLSIPFVKFILLPHLLDLFSTFTSYSVLNH